MTVFKYNELTFNALLNTFSILYFKYDFKVFFAKNNLLFLSVLLRLLSVLLKIL